MQLTPGMSINKNLYQLVANHNAGSARLATICLEGSSRSGKTWSWIEYLINLCEQMPGIVCSAFRHDASTHEKAAVRDFKRLCATSYPEVWRRGHWTNKPMQFVHANGSIIEFVGTNDPAKLHGPERDIAVLNEAMEISYDAYLQIIARTRLMVILDWNPSNTMHWVFDRVLSRPDVLYIHSTYRDNPHLTPLQVAAIESKDPSIPENIRNGTADKWWWEVYGLGKRGRREGTVYSLFDITDDWPDVSQCNKWGFGLDFGYSNDPTALVECCIWQGKLYLREWMYERGLTTIKSHAQPNIPSIQGRLESLEFDRRWRITADGARPDQIAELVAEGYNVTAASKGKGSILAGIDLVKRFPLMVHRGSQNLQNELQQYVWRKHAQGHTLAEPEDNNNHLLDAVRYWALDELAGWQPARPYDPFSSNKVIAVSGIQKRRY